MKAAVVVLVIHGGGFIGGSASALERFAEQFRAQGIPSRSIEYRRDDPRHGLADVRAVMRHELRRGRQVYLFGHSSGATLALRLAETGRPKAVVALAPIADLTDWRANALPNWEGSFADQMRAALTPAVVRPLDPLRHRCRGMSRTYMVAGDDDELVPMIGAQRFAKRCKQARLQVTHDNHLTVLNHKRPSWRRWLLAQIARNATAKRWREGSRSTSASR